MNNIEIRLPKINASTPSGQLEQVKTYLFQLTEQLNYAFDILSSSTENQKLGVVDNSNQSDIIVYDILSFSKGCSNGLTPFSTSANTINLPSDLFNDSLGIVNKKGERIIIMLTSNLGDMIAVNSYSGGAWVGWKLI